MSKKILLTGARSLFTLDLARRFYEQGYRVFTAETSLYHVCRTSNAVEKNFIVPSPRFKSEAFIQALVTICYQEEIDLLIPSFEEIFCLSRGIHLFPKSCQVFSEDYGTLDHLHNKWLFNKKIEALGFPTPQSYLIQTKKDLENLPLKFPYILKPSYCRASLCVLKITEKTRLKVEINPYNPFLAQEFIEGKKYCTYSISHRGRLTAHAVYPVEFSIGGNSCLNFEAIKHSKIQDWVTTFVEKETFTGHIAFDFIEDTKGDLYAIECNPRGTSGLHLFQKQDHLPLAFFNNVKEIITPQLGYAKQVAWGMLLYGWKTRHFIKFVKKLIKVKDVVYSKNDLKPFFYQPILFFVYLFKCFTLRMRLPAMFTFDTDWNGEAQTTFDQISCEESSQNCMI